MVRSSLRLAFLPAACRKAAVAVVAVALCAVPAAGQRISGTVVDGVNHLPVADLPVVVATAKGEVAGATRTGADGTFAVALKQPGAYTLRVLHMGYRPTELSFEVKDTATLRVQVELSPRRVTDVTLLSTVVINGRQVQVPSRFADVLERARKGNGALFTRADFDMTNDVKFALGTLPTVHVNQRGIFFRKCHRVQVYINGMRMFAPGDSPLSILKLVAPADIELMEVYTGVVRLPAEYINDACAAIAVWTK
ncbi:MAG: carboxypeptidase regulatory-like domain-containing protein [Gemmatimonadota bacterium]